jgi:hypothetical protein
MTEKLPKLRGKHSIVVVQLETPKNHTNLESLYLYVTSSSQPPETFFAALMDRSADMKLPGVPIRLRQDLVSNYKPSRSRSAIARRLKETKQHLDKLGHVAFPHWRVYVLDVDPDKPKRIKDEDRGEKNHVVYVGQTSKDIQTRLLEHQGERLGKLDRYLGAPSTKGRSPKLNELLTPTKRVFSLDDALNFETQYSQKLKDAGYGVLGDGLTDPAKRSRSKSAR